MVSFFGKEYTRTSRHNPCLACGDDKGNCQIHYTKTRIQCLNTHQDIPGWKYLKDASGGAYWGILVASDTDTAWSEAAQIKWSDRKREARAASNKGKLSPSLIDRTTRILASHFGLSRRHRENLRDRGLTDSQIDRAGFFSVGPFSKLPPLFPANYPGVKGGSLVVADEGIFCPAFNLDSAIAGGQIRLDNDNSGGKYRWLKGYKSSHLENGELPITVIQAGEATGEVWIAEGILKALVTGYKHNRLVAGASGGNFSGSPEQFQELVKSLDIAIATILPDAGDVKNPQVMRRWQNQYEYFRILGLFVRVGWWGQVDKHFDDDIDELPSGKAIEYISWEQFLAHAREHGGIEEEPNWWNKKQTNIGDYQERVRDRQLQDEDFTPWTSELRSERFLQLDINSLAKGVYLIKSGMGTGKSTLALEIVKIFVSGNILSYRNSLLQQICKKSSDKVNHIHNLSTNDNKVNKKLRNASSWTAACVDSCFLLPTKKVLILEEVDKLLQHMLTGGTCRKRRSAIIAAFVNLVQSADYVFCFDADLTPISARYLQEISGKNVFGIWNKGQVPAWKVTVYGGEKDIKNSGEVKEKKNARNGFDKQLISDALAGQKILVLSDSQRYLIGLEKELEKYGINVFRVDSYTKTDSLTSDSVNAFLDAPNTSLIDNKPQVVLISPTAESSLDITIPYFDRVYGAFFGVINHRKIMQMLARYRQPVERVIYCKTYSCFDNNASRSPLPEVVARNYFKHHQSALDLLNIYNYLPTDTSQDAVINNLSGLLNENSAQWRSPHFKAVCSYTAFDNYSLANLRELLVRDLLKMGHNVEVLPMSVHESFKDINQARDRWLQEESSSIERAEDIEYDAALKILESMSSSLSDRHKAIKAVLKHRLPGFDFNAEFIYEKYLKDPQYINQLELRWAVANLDKQKMFDTSKWLKSLSYGSEIWDMRCRALQASILIDLDLTERIDVLSKKLGGWTHDDVCLDEFKQACIKNRHRLRFAFGINASSDSDPAYLLKRVLSKIGVKVVRRRTRVGNGERKYFYNIDSSTLVETDTTTSAVFSAIDRRFNQLPNLSPTAQRYKKLYISSHSGTSVTVIDLDPLEYPQLINKLLKVESPVDNQQFKEVYLDRDPQSIVDFELGAKSILQECTLKEEVQDLLGVYSLAERQVLWGLLTQLERERMANFLVN